MPATGSRSMLSVIAAIFLTAVEGFGQSFIGLSTTWDGSTLYFSTALRQAGSGQPFLGEAPPHDSPGPASGRSQAILPVWISMARRIFGAFSPGGRRAEPPM